MAFNPSYREVIPNNLSQFEWHEVEINTGTQHTLQDIKAANRAGGFTFSYENNPKNRNRFIYWRTYEDALELSDISLDETLAKNRLRLRFPNTSVLALKITQCKQFINILVATGSSLHCFDFPLRSDTNGNGKTSMDTSTATHSIFYHVGPTVNLNALNTYYIMDIATGQHELPKTAACQLSVAKNEAIFSIAYLSKLMLHVMAKDGRVTTTELKEPNRIPRFLTNLTGVLIRKAEPTDYVVSMLLCRIDNEHYVLTLYQSEELRLWSATTSNIVSSLSLCNNSDDSQGCGLNAMRKISETEFCIYLSRFATADFILIKIHRTDKEAKNFDLLIMRTITAPDIDLTDFAVNKTRIWALFNNSKGQYSVSSYGLKLGMSMDWVSAAMEPSLYDRYNVRIEQGADPKEAYVSYIFHPGRFDPVIIKKSLNMFRNSSSMSLDLKQLSMNTLKEQVCQAVYEEIRNELRVYSDEDYLIVASRLWEHFYSCCEQYHYKHTEPAGLTIFESLDAVCIIRNQMFSLLRPCDMLEHIVLSGEKGIEVDIVLEKYFFNRYGIGMDFINLLLLLAQIEECLPEETKIDLDKKLYQLEIPSVIIAHLSDEVLNNLGNAKVQILPQDFLATLTSKLAGITRLDDAITMLHDILRNSNFETEENQNYTELSQSSKQFFSIGSLFSSEHGLSVLTETFKQNAILRYVLCRNLAILEQIIVDSDIVSIHIQDSIRNKFMPDTFLLMQVYYIVVWITETPIRLETPPTLESSLQALCRVQLKTKGSRLLIHYDKRLGSTTVLHMFLKTKGLHAALSKLVTSNTFEEGPTFNHTLMPLIEDFVYRLLWVLKKDFTFGEWLYNSGQHVITQDYVRLLNTWCEYNTYSRQYILAISLLDCEEVQKAYNLFLFAGRGVLKERFLFETFLKNTKIYEELERSFNDNTEMAIKNNKLCNRAIAYFYFKVTQLFEEHQAYSYIIKMSNDALVLLDKNDEYTPMFQSIIFNNNMILEHYEEAYNSLVYNVDVSRRKVGLRQLVLRLFEKKRLDLLMRFPYTGLYDEFQNIVETRARTLSMEENDVYDFIYAYHMNNENFRKASSIMYEQAMRLKLDFNAPNSLDRLISSLAVCINSLLLSDPKYRWIVKPNMGDEIAYKQTDDHKIMSNEQMSDDQNMAEADDDNDNENGNDVDIGDDDEDNINNDGEDNGDVESFKDFENTQTDIIVIEVDDLRRELYHAEALRQLAPHRKDIANFTYASANDLAYLLATNGLFTPAIRLAKSFKISLLPIFDSLALACVRLCDEKGTSEEGWDWLQENDLKELPHCKEASDVAWLFLQSLVEEHELFNASLIHKTVVNKLLTLNFTIPQWLLNSYKLRNCSQLLYLYVKHNRLFEAVDLAHEMLNAMLGIGAEYFSFQSCLGSTNPPMALPVRTIDLLLHRLTVNRKVHDKYKSALVTLEESIAEYLRHLVRVTEDKKMKPALMKNQLMDLSC